jgi:hypothetical protein
MADAEDDACRACTKVSCCDEIEACDADESCTCLVDCLANDGDETQCFLMCGQSATFITLATCIQGSCAEECGI